MVVLIADISLLAPSTLFLSVALTLSWLVVYRFLQLRRLILRYKPLLLRCHIEPAHKVKRLHRILLALKQSLCLRRIAAKFSYFLFTAFASCIARLNLSDLSLCHPGSMLQMVHYTRINSHRLAFQDSFAALLLLPAAAISLQTLRLALYACRQPDKAMPMFLKVSEFIMRPSNSQHASHQALRRAVVPGR